MSTGADNKSLPNTPEFDEGYRRIYGDKEPERGSWVWCPVRGKLIPKSEYVPVKEERAIDAPIITDRPYDGAHFRTMDEKNNYIERDVGSRKRYQEYLKETGTTHASDYTEFWKRKAAEREKVKQGEMPSKTRREVLERAFYKIRGY